MIPVKIKDNQVKYDADHDVLHVFFPPYAPSFDDEEYPGVIIRRSLIDERITGLKVLDFIQRDPGELKIILPQYKLDIFQKKFKEARY